MDQPRVVGTTSPGERTAAVEDDPVLAGLVDELTRIDDVELDQRIEVFERVNATIATELAALDEV